MDDTAHATTPNGPRASTDTLRLRPETPADEGFLFEVYASTRQEELAVTGWDQTTLRAFLEQQFKAMRHGYRQMFPQAEFSVILLDRSAIGRMVVDRSAKEIRLVDVALLPQYRNRGLGTHLMNQLLDEARRTQTPLRIHVLINSPAVRFYQRLGFVQRGQPDLYQEMEWRPGSAPSLPPK